MVLTVLEPAWVFVFTFMDKVPLSIAPALVEVMSVFPDETLGSCGNRLDSDLFCEDNKSFVLGVRRSSEDAIDLSTEDEVESVVGALWDE